MYIVTNMAAKILVLNKNFVTWRLIDWMYDAIQSETMFENSTREWLPYQLIELNMCTCVGY